jgi:hypothetical protein
VNALRTLARDGWVVGIAAAAALAYATINVLDELLALAFAVVDGTPAAGLDGGGDDLGGFGLRDFYAYDVVINGHLILLEPLLRAVALFAVVLVASAVALHATRSPEEEGAQRLQ